MTALESLIRLVAPAIAARMISGADAAMSGAVMLTDAVHVEADLLGQFRLLDDLPDPLAG